MSQFYSGNIYQGTSTSNLNNDFNINKKPLLSSTSNIDLSSVDEINYYTLGGNTETVSFDNNDPVAIYKKVTDYLEEQGVVIDSNDVQYYDLDKRPFFHDTETGKDYYFDAAGNIIPERNGSTVEMNYNWNTGSYSNQIDGVLSKYKINVSQDTEIMDFGRDGEKQSFLIGDYFLDIYNDGKVLLDGIDIINTKGITLSNEEIKIETSNGTWTIQRDGQSEYIRPNGEPYHFNVNKLKQLATATGTKGAELDSVTIDEKGHLHYHNKNDNSEGEFDSEGRIIKFAKDDVSLEYSYEPTQADYNALAKEQEFRETPNLKINYVARAKIKGIEIPYYSVGEQGDTDTFAYTIGSSLAYTNYSSRILSLIDQNFEGVIIAPWNMSEMKHSHEGIGAYYINQHIFVPYDGCDYLNNDYRTIIPIHEMGHFLSRLHYSTYQDPQNRTGWFREDVETLLKKYKSVLPTLPASGYTPATGYTTSPNDEEFFADASANYFLNPSELQRYAPELYEFMERMYGEKEYYHE